MSHEYYLLCRCGEVSNDCNHGQEMLVRAVKQSGILYELKKTGWRGDLEFEGREGLSDFLMTHYDHGGFIVRSEYYRVSDPASAKAYPDVEAYPEHVQAYAEVCIAKIGEEIEELQERLAKLKALSEASDG